jgi:hypothetical protein
MGVFLDAIAAATRWAHQPRMSQRLGKAESQIPVTAFLAGTSHRIHPFGQVRRQTDGGAREDSNPAVLGTAYRRRGMLTSTLSPSDGGLLFLLNAELTPAPGTRTNLDVRYFLPGSAKGRAATLWCWEG